jgi:tetratricopeptide (TPR) repeat protein/roadblock/LC7 domain-containing protein
MKNNFQSIILKIWVILSLCAAIGFCILFNRTGNPARYFEAFAHGKSTFPLLTITYPFDGALFPPDIRAPAISWRDSNTAVRKWLVGFSFEDGSPGFCHYSDSMHWTPTPRQWQIVQKHSVSQKASITIVGISRGKTVSAQQIGICTSTDPVDAPLFYREVTLPFKEAVKDPSKIRWRFGSITSEKGPPVVLENLPVCGNCHSFSADGRTLGMDVDYANDKGSYAVVPVGRNMVLDSSDILSWSDFRKKDNVPTFGLLSQVSPDGKWVVSTVKDNSVFVPKPQLDFSQLFFPVKGILAVYNRAAGTFSRIPGADDPAYVQSNPVWSPDGNRIVFIRSKVYKLNIASNQVLLSPEQCVDFLKNGKLFLYDLYQIPFNNGRGGTATPLRGASNNGMSNYFPRFSPDGKWIVFCKARSFSLLQPDSKLYIMPAHGGEPRLMACNRSIMNSWHSWSPNGKWLVFSSKAFTPYTQIFLTHIDEKGMDTPPVALDWLTSPDRAANIPEFVNAAGDAIEHIQERFVNDISYLRAAREYVTAFDLNSTIFNLYHKAIAINPRNAQAHYGLATVLSAQNKNDEAVVHYKEAIRLDSTCLMAYCNLATTYAMQGHLDEAISCYQKVLRRKSIALDRTRNGASTSEPGSEGYYIQAVIFAHTNLAYIFVKNKLYDKAITEYAEAVRLDPSSPDLHCGFADIFMLKNDFEKARYEYTRAVDLNPDFERAFYNLGIIYQKINSPKKAMENWQKVLKLNPNNSDAANNIQALKNLP